MKLMQRHREFRLMQRDETLLADLYKIRAVLESDVADKHFGGSRSITTRRMTKLESHDYIRRESYAPTKHGYIGKQGKFITLTTKGVNTAEHVLGYDQFELFQDHVPDKTRIGKYVLAGSVYMTQFDELKRNGWEWEPVHLMKRFYGDDLRLPSIGYLVQPETKQCIPLFVILSSVTKGRNGRIEKALLILNQLVQETRKLGELEVEFSIIFVSDEVYPVAIDRLKAFAVSPFRVVPASMAKHLLASAIEESHPTWIKLHQSDSGERFPYYTLTAKGREMFYVNLAHFDPTDVWKVVAYDQRRALEEARLRNRPVRGVIVTVSDTSQMELIKNRVDETSHMMFYTTDGKRIG